MWIEHNYEFSGIIYGTPQVKKNAFNQNEVSLTIKTDGTSIPTELGKTGSTFFNGKFKCPDNPTSWTDNTCLPKWIKKDAPVLVKGKIDGRINDKKGEVVPSSYFLNFSDVIAVEHMDKSVSKASGRGEIYAAKHINDNKETFFLIKEALKKMKPGDPPKFRYYRVLVPKALNLDTYKSGRRPFFYGELARNVLPVPDDVQSRIDNGDNKAKYDICFGPVVVADEFYL